MKKMDTICQLVPDREESLQRLEQLAQKIHEDYFDITEQRGEDWIRIETKQGDAHIYYIDKIPAREILDNAFTPGTIFPVHEHPSIEWVLVYEGELHVYEEGNDKPLATLFVGDGYKFPPGMRHWAYCPVETKVLAILIPAGSAFEGQK